MTTKHTSTLTPPAEASDKGVGCGHFLVRRPRLVNRCYYTQSRELRNGRWTAWNCDSPHFARKNDAVRHWQSRREWLATGTHYVPKQSRLVHGVFDYRCGLPYKLTRRVLRRCASPLCFAEQKR